MKPSIIHIITLLHTFISIINAQNCGTDCSGCNRAPLTCEDDTPNRCIYDYIAFQCVVDQCGPNCILCDNDETACELDSLPCFWIVDNNKCRPANDCQSYCALCTNANDCDAIGSGGDGLCEWDIGEQACEGTTCNTNCDECSGLGKKACEESNALPNGCRIEKPGSEQCIALTANPTTTPTSNPTTTPTTKQPTTAPSPIPSYNPSISPTNNPSLFPTNFPTHRPSPDPTPLPTEFPSYDPTQTPTIDPTEFPSPPPTTDPTALPSDNPTRAPNVAVDEIVCGDIINNILPANDEKLYSFQLPYDTIRIIISLCNTQTTFATEIVLLDENNNPLETDQPCQPGSQVTRIDIQSGLQANSYFITISGQTSNDFGPYQLELTCVTPEPTNSPSKEPTEFPTFNPTKTPTIEPTITPTYLPTNIPTTIPTINPTEIPTAVPTINPSDIPTTTPTINPITLSPVPAPITGSPTPAPTGYPTPEPTRHPTPEPTGYPTPEPSVISSNIPTNSPIIKPPSYKPTDKPTYDPTEIPSSIPTIQPTSNPSNMPSMNPTHSPSKAPTYSMNCPYCAYNVSLIMIGNVTIEECTDSSSISSSDSDSSSSSSDSNRRLLRLGYRPWVDSNSESESIELIDGITRCLSQSSSSSSSDSDSDDGTNKLSAISLNEFVKNECDENDNSDSDSDSNEENDKQFLTEVCITYAINDLVKDDSIDCGEVRNVFLGLCENNQTDFNSSNIDENDLTNLIVSIYPNDTNQIISATGSKNKNDELGILIEFNKGHNVNEFKLCLGNVTVDTMFNKEKHLIQIGNGSITIEDNNGNINDQCPADGLPCLNFYFGKTCEKCQCNNGISELSIQYNGECTVEKILIYYDIQNDIILCEFNNVNNGDVKMCKPINNIFNDNTYIKIISNDNDCSDFNGRRRLDSNSNSDSDSNDNNELNNRCLALFNTDCSLNIVNTKSKGCNVLTAVSFVDGNGNFCDKNTNKDSTEDSNSHDNSNSDSDENIQRNVLIIGERTHENPLQIFDELNVYVKWILFCTLIVFGIVTTISFYICVVHKTKKNYNYVANNIKYKRTHLNTFSVTEYNDHDFSGDNDNNNIEEAKSIENDTDDFYNEPTFTDEFYNECSIDLKKIKSVEKSNDNNSNKFSNVKIIQMTKTVLNK